ncbi:MAG: sulfite exporter TauE/SafE family protein [Planctomycetota bacterium]|nr:sulfite exporter TauE/SafE family protein [Planctomycetota bacterium]MDA1179770.1 sulfite exporter TauE/SafE family protein [Planctomycetota bacterium]
MELFLIFTSGFLGSAHCLGMCGPFALTLGATSRSWKDNLSRQLLYSLGRIFTYGVLGAVAGYAGMQLAGREWNGVHLAAAASIAAGAFLIYEGLASAGVLRRRVTEPAAICLAGSLLGSFLRGPRRTDVFLAGLATGFLPCGLVYGFLGLAAASSSLGYGLLLMVCFGLGTVPGMVGAGLGGGALTGTVRRRMFTLAAWSLVLAGGISVWRGVAFLQATPEDPACPFCTSANIRPPERAGMPWDDILPRPVDLG